VKAGGSLPPPSRVASFLAAGTELVCALGAGDRLVARSHECDYPEWVKTLPAVSRPTFPITGSSAEIDALVRERIGSGQPLYEVDHSLLDELSPDLLVTQTHCDVCAVAPADIARGAKCSHATVSMAGGTVEDVLRGFSRVAGALGLESAGEVSWESFGRALQAFERG